MKINILLLFLLNFIIKCNYAQVTPFLKGKSCFVQPDSSSKRCLVQASVGFDYDLEPIKMSYLSLSSPFNATDFQAFPIYTITDIYHQMILLSFKVDPSDTPIIPTFRFYANGIDESFDLPEVICKPIQPYNFKLTNYHVVPNDKSSNNFIYLQFNFTKESGFRDVGCATNINMITCFVSRTNIFSENYFVLVLFLSSPYQTLEPKIEISLTLNFYDYNITFEVDNPFPWNVTRTSIVKSIDPYPNNGYIFYEDFRLQRDLKKFVTQFVTIENMNSILATNSFYYLVENNSTHSTYGASMSINKYFASSLFTYLLDSTGNSEYVYTSQFSSIDFSSIQPFWEIDSFILDNTQFISFYIDYPYISDYNFIYTLYGKPQQFKLPRPYITNYTTIETPNLYKYVIPFNGYKNTPISAVFDPLGVNQNAVIQPNPALPESIFRINSFNLYRLSAMTSLVNISVTSNYPISYISTRETIANQTSLVSVNNDTYIFQFETPIIQNPMFFSIYDIQGNSISVNEGQFYNDNYQVFYSNQVEESKYISASDITYMRFEKTEIDFSNGPVYNTLYFNFSKYLPSMLPYLYFDTKGEYEYQGGYDFDLQLFVINFTLHSWVTDPNLFNIEDRGKSISGFSITSTQYNFEKMTIKNPDGDIKPPFLTNLDSFQFPGSIGWILTISDSKNGFKSGSVNIVSEFDTVPYTLNFTVSDRKSGDQFNGVYNISFVVPNRNCRSQTFVLNTLVLRDIGPIMLEYDSLSTIRGTPQEDLLKILRNCTGSNDNEPPELVSIDFQPTIEVGSVNRTFEVKFITKDIGSGISKRHNPIIYLASETNDVIQINSQLVSNNQTHFSYIATQQLPYGFGNRYLFVSVYGLADNRHNYRSYSMLDLKNMSLPFYSAITFNRDTPILYSSTPISNRGGSLTIYGSIIQSVSIYTNASQQPQGLIAKIDYHDGKGYQPIIPEFSSSLLIQLTNIKEINSPYISIQLERNGIKSNELKVYPYVLFKQPAVTPSPTPTPSQTPSPSLCPGTPPCSNRGTCKSNGCSCNFPWYGSSCSSEIIIIPKPSPQPEPSTSVNITTSITSSVDISEIREINGNNDIIKSYKIDEWNLTDLSGNSSNPTFIYQTILNSTSTNVRVSIVFFSNQTNITFGDQTLEIAPSSIKFSIEISEYKFQSPLNLLQIVMDSTIKGNDDDTCSSQQLGSDTGNPKENIQWIKLNINKISLYGRFIDFGIIDDRVTKISNRLIDATDDQTNQFRSVKIGITVPSYQKSIYLDPDFSNLIDVADEDVDLLCKKKKKLSSGAIAGIVVGTIVFISLVVGTVMYLYRKSKLKKEQKRIQTKLKNMQ